MGLCDFKYQPGAAKVACMLAVGAPTGGHGVRVTVWASCSLSSEPEGQSHYSMQKHLLAIAETRLSSLQHCHTVPMTYQMLN